MANRSIVQKFSTCTLTILSKNACGRMQFSCLAAIENLMEQAAAAVFYPHSK